MNRLATHSLEHAPVLSIEQPYPPIAVDIGERAVALAEIMEYLNQASSVKGAEQANGALVRRYGAAKTPDVVRGMKKKRDDLKPQFDQGIDTLIAADALRANGWDEADLEVLHISMQAAINHEFGVGRTHADARHELVTQASRLALTQTENIEIPHQKSVR